MDRLPLVSVIIPTHNRRDSIARTLDTLGQQTYPCSRYEVIVVDDGSTDGTEEVGEKVWPATLRYIRQPSQGATVARNRGAAEASGKVLLFLDDDITIVPGFLENMVQAHEVYDQVVLVGALRPLVRERGTTFQRVYAWHAATTASHGIPPFEAVPFTDCLTGLFSVKREHFFAIGGLQDLAGDGRAAWGDVDFGYRARRLGFRFIRCNQAVGFHDDFATADFATYACRWQHASHAAVLVFQVYPEIQRHLPMFRDKAPILWHRDPPPLVARKLARQITSSRPALRGMQGLVNYVEQHGAFPFLLRSLYRWIISAHIYKGYRQGLLELPRKRLE